MRDELVARLAAGQGGQVSTAQLLAAGLDRAAIARRVTAGRLHRGPRGVYSVGHVRTDRAALRWAALLAGGPGAVLSHRTAAAVWDLTPPGIGPIHITVARPGGRAPRRGIVTHRSALRPGDITMHDGFAVTTVERTLLDIAPLVSDARLAAAVERAEFLRLIRARELERVLATRRKGAARLRAALAEPLTVTRSMLERRMLVLCRDHGIERPLVNETVCGLEVDFVWPAANLVVEADGGEFHRTRAAFERDRRRDVTLMAAGLRVARFTHRQITQDAVDTARGLLALGAPRATSSRRSA